MALVIPIFIPHRGCPHDCLFCNQQKISGVKKDDVASDAGVRETIDLWLERAKLAGSKRGTGPVEVAFYGGSFTCMDRDDQQSLLQQVAPYIVEKKVDSIRCSTRPDCITEEICEWLYGCGVRTVELGVQSLTELVLAKVQRGHNATQSMRAANTIKQAGLTLGIQLMVGLPGESTGSFLRTIDQVISLGPDFVRLYPTLVVAESGLEILYREGGYMPLTLQKAVAICARGYQKLSECDIKVVRMGLQPSPVLESSIVSGPYHQAFGDLVRSRLWMKRIRDRLCRVPPQKKLVIQVSHRDLSTVVGNGKCNIKRLDKLGYSGRYQILVDKTMERGCVKYVVSD